MNKVPTLLWLHKMGPRPKRRLAVEDFEQMLEPFSDVYSTLIWDADDGAPAWLRSGHWDLIVLGPTFLASRNEVFFGRIKREFAWVADSAALKVAFPQDEYDDTLALNLWFLELGVDVVYSCFADFADVLYRKIISNSIEIRQGFSAVISQSLQEKSNLVADRSDRHLDVVYRAHSSSRRFGYLGWLKVMIGPKFDERLHDSGVQLISDISSKIEDTKYGQSWIDFLQSSKFTLAVPSGSSVLDYNGDYRRALRFEESLSYFDRNWDSDLIPEEAKTITFEALSPRHVEAALLGTAQVGFPGNYSNVLIPGESIIRLESDFSNFDEVIQMMMDKRVMDDTAVAAMDSVMSQSRLFPSTIAGELAEMVLARVPRGPQTFPRSYHPTPNAGGSEKTTTGRRVIFWAASRLIVLIRRLRSPVLRVIRPLFSGKRNTSGVQVSGFNHQKP